ncbi:hypothetical protein [Marinobacter sp. CHS3-4]|uniref:hypothetical protein n=1 Tax=Marinobacter sp. CHS3-4 TaxID=3045174 RepID=UPI0024B4CDA1|nr:hypothetical protein [Marinobacter sp. CHS3-4]MDI9243710.1 hypothetical protein [Marinobacter sp. CHS3-4]
MITTRYTLMLLLAATLLTGCGPDTSGDSRPPNPAQTVVESFETFTLENEEGLPPVLPDTLFYDFYRGIEPAEGEDDQNTAAAIRGRLDTLMGLTPSADGKTYVAARNPIDFLNFVINSNLVGNFNEGRQLMRRVITSGVPALYNSSPENGTTILFTETGNESSGSDQVWRFPLLDWRNNPSFNTVATARRFDAGSPASESEPEPEVQDVIWSARFDDANFAVSGYNQPDVALFSLTARTLGNLELQTDYTGLKTDIVFLALPPSESETEEGERCENVPPENDLGLTIGGQNPDCLRIVLDYEDSQARVFTSRGEAPLTSDCKAFNANYCGFKRSADNEELLTFETITIDSRQ